MIEHHCPDCDYIATSPSRLKRHLNRTYPCNVGKLKCDKCSYRTDDRSNMFNHRKRCKGRKVPRIELERHDARIQSLVLQIQELQQNLEVKTASAIASENSADTIIVKENPTWLNQSETNIKTTGITDIKRKQVYFFECGPALLPFEDQEGTPIKFGETDGPYKRIMKHKHDFEGGRLLDSVVTNNPKAVENDLKMWMKATDRIVRCKTKNKQTNETEVFAAKSQEDYATIVEKAKEFAEDYRRDVETLSVCQDQLKEALAQMDIMKKAFIVD